MAEAIRRDCDPVLFALGFRNPRKGDMYRWETTRRNVYIRWRGVNFDQVWLQWDKYNRPKFFLYFESSRVDRPPHGAEPAIRSVCRGIFQSWRSPSPYVGGGWFGPWRSPDGVAALVNRRVQALDPFLLHGEVAWPINPGKWRQIPFNELADRLCPQRRIWGDPWRDPESDYLPD
jgi:hypothetical protein